jgi:hypothetical protein
MSGPIARPLSPGMKAAWQRWAQHPRRSEVREHARLRAGIERLRCLLESQYDAPFKREKIAA